MNPVSCLTPCIAVHVHTLQRLVNNKMKEKIKTNWNQLITHKQKVHSFIGPCAVIQKSSGKYKKVKLLENMQKLTPNLFKYKGAYICGGIFIHNYKTEPVNQSWVVINLQTDPSAASRPLLV